MAFDEDKVYVGKSQTWSMSRYNRFKECKRSYFLNYYAALTDPEIKRVSKLSSIPLWVGNVVHDYAESFLKTVARIPGPEEQEKIIRQITHGQMAQDWRFSEAGTKKFRLQEHEYGVLITDREKRVAVGLAITCMRNFFASPVLAEMCEVGKKQWFPIEELLSYDVLGTKTWVKMDAAYRGRDGRVVIADCKTGRTIGKTNQSQLVGYAAYAVQAGWAKTPEDVETILAYLAVPTYQAVKVTPAMVGKVRELIGTSAMTMGNMIDSENHSGVGRDFPKDGPDWACRRCGFRGMCFPGKYQGRRGLPSLSAADSST